MSEAVIIDLSNYKDRVGARVTEGRYRVQVEDAELTKANSGNQMINLWFRIIGGEHSGATIVDRLVLTEKSMFRVVGFMQAIGIPTPKKKLKLPLQKFVGKVLEIDVEDGEPYMGRVKSEVRGYLRVKASETSSDEQSDEEEASEAPVAEAKETSSEASQKADTAKADDEEIDLDEFDL